MRHLPADSPHVTSAVESYERIRAEYVRVGEAIKAAGFEKQLAYLDKMDFTNRTKYFWRMIARLRGDKTADQSFAIKNLSGIISSSKEEFCENWVNFYQRLYQPQPQPSKLREHLVAVNSARAAAGSLGSLFREHVLDRDLDFGEFKKAIKTQRNGAAPGFG